MKKTMAKNSNKPQSKVASKTDELLKKLGMSLRESPLNAHARGAEQMASSMTPERGQGSEKKVTEIFANEMPNISNPGETNPVHIEKVAIAAAQMVVRAPVESENRSFGERKILTARDSVQMSPSFAPEAMQTSQNENGKIPVKAASVSPSSKENSLHISPLELAENFNRTMLATGAALTHEQISALQKAPDEITSAIEMENDLPQADSLAAGLERLEAPMSEEQVNQWKDMQAMKAAIAELKNMQRDIKAPKSGGGLLQARDDAFALAQVAARTPGVGKISSYSQNVPSAMPYAGGSFRPTASGWKTSTVGMYPEDYEKAYEVMNYLRAQTGQAVNLSRVIKIALRAMEVGPKVLEINAQIKAKDGRLLSRRA